MARRDRPFDDDDVPDEESGDQPWESDSEDLDPVDDSSDPEPIGWIALDEHLRLYFPDGEKWSYGPIVPFRQGGQYPLDGISVFWVRDPAPHYLFVTFGLSELFDKQSGDPEVSGWGFELTFRLAAEAEDEGGEPPEPPMWVMNFLQYLAQYVFRTGNVFGDGHTVNLAGPLTGSVTTQLEALVLTTDPIVATATTPHGTVEFLQVVGLTADEYRAVRDWTPNSFLPLLERSYPLLITDMTRESVLRDEKVAAHVAAGIVRDGSSRVSIHLQMVEWGVMGKKVYLRLSAYGLHDCLRTLAGRIPYGRPLALEGPEQAVQFTPQAEDKPFSEPLYQVDGDLLSLPIRSSMVRRLLETLPESRGIYDWPEWPNVTVEVVPTEICDQDNNVTDIVG